jgi:hypothetical protein
MTAGDNTLDAPCAAYRGRFTTTHICVMEINLRLPFGQYDPGLIG